MFTVEAKNLLAKLMATENITVVHSNVRTAKFNLTHRILTCPVWKYMDGDLYDLLMGHEVSHALHTPPEGWHDAIIDARSEKKRAFKHFLNVIEDARIELLIKNKYPGLKQPMQKGYKTLLAKDFFGTSVIENFNDVYLIDKLNLAAKLGTAINIRFTEQEKHFYEEMMRLETWAQVVDLTKRVYEYSKKEQQEGEKKKKELMRQMMEEAHEEEEEEQEEGEEQYEDDYEYDEFEEDEEGGFGDGEGEGEEEDGEGGEEGGEDEEDSGEMGDRNGRKNQGEQQKEGGNQTKTTPKPDDKGKDSDKVKGEKKEKKDKKKDKQKNDGTPEHGTEGGDFTPRAKTDEAFRQKEKELVENTDIEQVYVKMPTPNLSHLFVPASRVNYGITSAVLTDQDRRNKAIQIYQDFRKKNHDYIMLLVKEFEMRKAARSYQKRRISETGDIDNRKLSRYLLDDDIFRKLMIVQKGKSHGLLLLLDKSGSMSGHIRGAMEQILVFALFCRKVNIPFMGFTFTDTQTNNKEFDFPTIPIEKLRPFSRKTGEMVCRGVDIREMFNSRMSASKFTQAVINHLVMSEILSHKLNWVAPSYEKMGGTPLNEAIIGMRDVAKRFKELNKLDIVNMVIVHDGDSDAGGQVFTEDRERDDVYRSSSWGTKSFTYGRCQVTIVDEKERLNIRVNRDDRRGFTQGLLKWFQMTTGVGVFGFYIVDGKSQMKQSISTLYTNKNGISFESCEGKEDRILAMNKLLEIFNEQKFLESYNIGYTRFYLVVGGGDLIGDSGLLQDTGKTWTPSRLLTAFKKVAKRKHVSRVMVSRFIELISSHE